jgi:uroporphyrinogen decarboxylase
MPDDVPLIGLSAAPFTLASRMIEGQPTRNFARTKYFMSQYPSAWLELMSKISLSIITLSRNQLEAGAQCLQLLDVPSGCLGTNQYRDLVWPFVRRVLEELLPLAPVVHCVGVSALMMGPSIAMGQGFSVDWRTPLDFVSQLLGPTVLQGNLDPAALLMNPRGIESQVRYVLNAVRGQKGHVFNVGSSILPPTPPAHVAAAVDMVHQLSRR